jgi:hypothetical protein
MQKDLDQVCDLLDREVKLQTLIVQSLVADFATRVPTLRFGCAVEIFSAVGPRGASRPNKIEARMICDQLDPKSLTAKLHSVKLGK